MDTHQTGLLVRYIQGEYKMVLKGLKALVAVCRVNRIMGQLQGRLGFGFLTCMREVRTFLVTIQTCWSKS